MPKRRDSRWNFFLPGNVYAYGPTTLRYASEREVREMILRSWYPSRKRLPRGVQIWRA